MVPVQVQTWGDAFLASISQAMAIFLTAIPKVIGFAVILLVGWSHRLSRKASRHF